MAPVQFWEASGPHTAALPRVTCPFCKRKVADVNGKYSYHGPGPTGRFHCPGSMLYIPSYKLQKQSNERVTK